MSDTSMHRATTLPAIRGHLGLRTSLAAIRAWFTVRGGREKSLTADLDRHHRDMFMLQQLGMTRSDVTRMIDHTHR